MHRIAELAIGALIVGARGPLLLRWRRGYFHLHPHRHGDVVHAHPHVHEHAPHAAHEHPRAHEHPHAEALGRTPLAAYGIGLVHGIGGSAGAGILLVGSIEGGAEAALALVALRAGDGRVDGRSRRSSSATCSRASASRCGWSPRSPCSASSGVLFGAWYALGSLEAVPYVF